MRRNHQLVAFPAIACVVAGAVTGDKITSGPVTTTKLPASGSSSGKVPTSTGSAVAWQTPAAGGLTLPYTGTASTSGVVFRVANTNSAGLGIKGTTDGGVSSTGDGVQGLSGANRRRAMG